MNTFLEFSFQLHKEIGTDLSLRNIVKPWSRGATGEKNLAQIWTFKCQVQLEPALLNVRQTSRPMYTRVLHNFDRFEKKVTLLTILLLQFTRKEIKKHRFVLVNLI